MRQLQAVSADYPFSGPNTTTLIQPIDKSAEAVFAALEDGPTWKKWLGIDVEWTSEKPFGIGTTRTVSVAGQQIDELFLLWDKPHQMAFRFERTSLPLAAFAEDYTVVATGPNRCELRWTFASEWGGPLPSIFGRIFILGFSANAKNALKKLAKLMASTHQFDH